MIFSMRGTGCLGLHQFVVGFSGMCCQRSFDKEFQGGPTRLVGVVAQ